MQVGLVLTPARLLAARGSGAPLWRPLCLSFGSHSQQLLQTRSIVRLVTRDKTLGSFDSRDAPLQPVNPYGLTPKANNAAGVCLPFPCLFGDAVG